MGLFDFFKKKKKPSANSQSNVLLAMPMFNDGETYDLQKVVDYLKNDWNLGLSEVDGSNETASFTIDGEMVVIATMPAQIPWSDISATAQYSYNWPTAEEDLKNHDSHVLVTMLSGKNSEYERFKILTKVLSAIVATSNCIGVYQGLQSLLIPRQQYLQGAEILKQGKNPVDLWIYIGLRKNENGNSAYTYGLKAFGKLEMEFVDTPLSLEEMLDFLSNIASYVIGNDVTFRSGETLGYTEEQKIRIVQSNGKFLEGETLKLEI